MLTTHKNIKNKNDIRWQNNFQLLCEYKEEFGDCNVPFSYIYKGVKLGLWVYNQRQAYKGKGSFTLTQDRIIKLNSIGFIWDHFDNQWENNFQLLCEYKEEFGDCHVPSYYIYKETNLGIWCSSQRRMLSKLNKNNHLIEKRINKLNSIGFIWDVIEFNWDTNFNVLIKYKEEFGDCNVPYNYIYNGVKLGLWVCTQRQAYKGNRNIDLSQDKINKLNSIGFIWDNSDYNWYEKFNLLCEYKEEFGDCNVPEKFIYKNINLGRWCINQRQAYKGQLSSNLNNNRIDKLNSIGFKW